MSRIITYLTFSGNCREAMTFYNECLEGELCIQTIGESPMANKLPCEMKKYILQASITKEDIIILGTDMVSENGLIKGNSVSIFIYCNSENEMKRYYNKLSDGSRQITPPGRTIYGSLFAELTDKYENHWLFNYKLKNALL